MNQLTFFQALGMVTAAILAMIKVLTSHLNHSQRPKPLTTVSWNG
jgi:hypothetical protein